MVTVSKCPETQFRAFGDEVKPKNSKTSNLDLYFLELSVKRDHEFQFNSFYTSIRALVR